MSANRILIVVTVFLLWASYHIGLIVVPFIMVCGYFLGSESGEKVAKYRDYFAGFQEGKRKVYAEYQDYLAAQHREGEQR